jgi:hypothetical protein
MLVLLLLFDVHVHVCCTVHSGHRKIRGGSNNQSSSVRESAGLGYRYIHYYDMSITIY